MRQLSLFLLLALFGFPVLADSRQAALRELVAAERAFARDGAALGQREAWLKWFAPDGVMFRPGPAKAHEVMRDPEQPTAPAGSLDWAPSYGDVSRSGDLGFNTGPVTARDPNDPSKPPRHSFFFSVWKRQPDGSWKVALDLGARVPQPGDASRWLSGPFVAARQIRSGDGAGGIDELLAHDAVASPYLDEARALRWDAPLLIGGRAIARYDEGNQYTGKREPAGGGVSAAGDMAYTYGKWIASERRSGFYARVWKRNERGEWRIAFEVARPDPPF
jgi:ketosteroid isomerase-like protein